MTAIVARGPEEATPLIRREEATCCVNFCERLCMCIYNPINCCGICNVVSAIIVLLFGTLGFLYGLEVIQDHSKALPIVFVSIAGFFGLTFVVSGIRLISYKATSRINGVIYVDTKKVIATSQAMTEGDEIGRRVGRNCAQGCCS